MLYPGTYGGLVEDNKDPDRRGRLKVRVPAAHDDIGIHSIPWALPRGLPAGNSPASGGISWLPEPGDEVWVTFLDGLPEKPLWEWAVQSNAGRDALKLHQYDAAGKPVRVGLTRHGHTLEINNDSILLVTKAGNVLNLNDLTNGLLAVCNEDIQVASSGIEVNADNVSLEATGAVQVNGDAGVALSGKDIILNATEDVAVNAGGLTILINDDSGSTLIDCSNGQVIVTDAGGSTFTMDGKGNVAVASAGGASVSIENDGNIQLSTGDTDATVCSIEKGQVTVTAKNVLLNSANVAIGASATSTVALADALVLAFNTHSHPDSNGGVTGPPIVPLTAQLIGSKTTLVQ